MKNIFAFCLFFLTFVGIVPPLAAQTFSGGSGTPTDPYLITTPAQLNAVRNDLTASYRLVNDIDLSGYNTGAGWVPIGTGTPAFTGTFDGAGFAITGLTINNSTANYVGLFGYVGASGTVKNINSVSGSINDTNNENGIGGVAGRNDGLVQCCASGVVITVGNNGKNVGGVVGLNAGTVQYCISTGTIASNNAGNLGGLVGYNLPGGKVDNSYNTGNVTGNNQVGGVVGRNEGAVNDCFNTGVINGGTPNGGGVVGENSGGTITGSFFDHSVNNSNLPGIGGGTGTPGAGTSKSTSDLQNETTFTNAGWDFTNIWFIDPDVNGGYPQLLWTLFGGGSGTEDNPYLIYTAKQLDNVREALSAYYLLMADINLSGYGGDNWRPIGDATHTFKGYFKGNGHVIENLTINRSTTNDVGLFGSIGGGTVENLGIFGGSIKGQTLVGGVAGSFYGGLIQDCYNTATISGAGDQIGGIVGYINDISTVQDCYNRGAITGNDKVGGIVGDNLGTVQQCYNAFSVTGSTNVGAVVGNNGGTVSTCFFDSTIADADTVSGIGGGTTTGTTGLATDGSVDAMTYYDVLLTGGALNALGSHWVKRLNNPTAEEIYYPELTVFYGDGTLAAKAQQDSKASVTVSATPISPYIITTTLPDGTVDVAYSEILDFIGTPDVTLSITDGALPDGLDLDPVTGKISGTPTADGTFTFTVTATNAKDPAYSRELTITIHPAAPVIITNDTDNALPNGTVDESYTATLEATGLTPITWSLKTGSALPDGLTLNGTTGVISGTPTTAGTFEFTVVATNTIGSAEAVLSITIEKGTPDMDLKATNVTTRNDNIFLTATVSITGPTAPTGNVEFYEGATYLGTAALNASGVAAFTVNAPFSKGTHTYTANYLGDDNFEGQTANVEVVVPDFSPGGGGGGGDEPGNTKANAGMTLTASDVINIIDDITLTATLSAEEGGGVPTGTVTFKLGNTVLGSADVDESGVAVFTTPSPFWAGPYTYTAIYSGDDNYSTNSATVTVEVPLGIFVSPNYLHFIVAGETKPITVKCNANEWVLDPDASWVSVSSNETEDYTMFVTAQPNPAAGERTMLLTFRAGVMVQYIRVVQDGASVQAIQQMETPSVIVYSQGGNVFVKSDAPIQRIAVYDVSGKVLRILDGGDVAKGFVQISNLPTQHALIVNVATSNGETKKLIIN